MKRLIALVLLFVACRKELQIIEETPSSKSLSFIQTEKEKPKWKDEIIVEFFSGDDNAAIRSIGGTHKERILTKAMERLGYKPFHVIKVPDVSNAVETLKKNPNVKSVSPNYIIYSEEFPDDPYYLNNEMWGLKNIKVDQVWPTNKGSQKVHIGLIDEGIMYFHEDLCGQIWNNPYEIDSNGVDDDGNGYIDDMHGWCFYHNHNKIWDNADQHGTHTAGTIGAKTNNSIGVAGVNPDVTIISAKFLQVNGSTDAAVKAFDYITGLKLLHPEMIIPATSNSWGYQGSAVSVLLDAINRAKAADILAVCAAGNSNANADIQTFYPAGFTRNTDNVISVGAIDANDNRASFSNYGATSVDIFAPGVNIWSTVQGDQVSSGYSAFNGTSMATPHVSGAIALYTAGHPASTYLQTRTAIMNSARPVAALNGLCKTGGTLDVSTFAQGSSDIPEERTCKPPFIDYTPPTVPTNVRQTGATNSSITVAWDASSDPESGIYFYGVQVSRPGMEDLLPSTYNTSMTIGGLPEGTDFTIKVYAINNAQMQSGPSDPITASTTGQRDITPPSTPTGFRVVDSSTSAITLTWNHATDNVGIYKYEIHFGDTLSNPRDHWYGGSNIYYPWQSVSIGGLPTGRLWHFVLRSVDLAGNRSPNTDTLWCHTLGDAPPPPPPPPPSDTEPPVATINSPADGSTLPQRGNKNVTISISASDNVGVTGTQILIDGVIRSTSTTYTWQTNKVSRGSHTITAKATDAAGNTGSKTITVVKN